MIYLKLSNLISLKDYFLKDWPLYAVDRVVEIMVGGPLLSK